MCPSSTSGETSQPNLVSTWIEIVQIFDRSDGMNVYLIGPNGPVNWLSVVGGRAQVYYFIKISNKMKIKKIYCC
jgi:hypothetical protein